MDSQHNPETLFSPLVVGDRHAYGATARADYIARRVLIGVVSAGLVAVILSIAGPSSLGEQVGEARRRQRRHRRRHRRKRSSQPTATGTPSPTPTPTPTPTSTP